MAGRIHRGRTVSKKRHGDWVGSAAVDGSTALAASTVLLDQVFIPDAPGETVIRTRGLFGVESDQSAASESANGAVGIGVVSAQAVSVGITAVPHPVTDAGWNGWFWHSYWNSTVRVSSAVGFQNLLRNITIDSKAMRKVGDEERVVIVLENSATVGVRFFMDVRIYSKPY